ncbi:MAG: isoprenylcysteine carboxylmethyltransferase family protein [Candidatus Omnitrophota bacterium]|jgi:protein-S-isoprenylcysteine O-methyltransferase Ste14|nr:MAG: isoprenylcysteine carboxylmethyltransferase family protein [Candidatus Omnitrophota bacterium]
MKARLKINGVITVLSLAILGLFPGFFVRSHSVNFWEESAEILGFACILLGQLFRTSARGYKAEFSQEGKALIQAGPYAFVRNPMYLGILLIGLGIVMVLLNWQAAFIIAAVFIVRYFLLIFEEEKKLLKLFPGDYADYCQKVPRLLPSAESVVSKDMREYLPLRWIWLKKEIGTILAVLVGVLVVESWGDLRNEGTFVYFKESIWIGLALVWFISLILYLTRTALFKKYASGKSDIAL